MRILFYIEPLVMHNRPFHYWAWLGYSAQVFRALRDAGKDYRFRFLVNRALWNRAVSPYVANPPNPSQQGQGLSANLVVMMDQESIREIFNAPNIAILDGLHRRTWSSERVATYGRLIREKLGNFVPDIIITRTPVPHLSAAYPDALVLGTECGPFSRRPYPITTFYDPRGLWAESIPGAYADRLIERHPDAEEKQFLDALRQHYLPYFLSTSPFGDLEKQMRHRFRRLALLPLQFAGESGFDLNSPFRNQGEYLFHVLERLPRDVGLLVVEHPSALWIGDFIDEETRHHLEREYRNVVFIDCRTIESAGQHLVHHVDYVICISSSLALQALFWSKPLVSVGWSHYRPYATFQGVESIDVDMESHAFPSRDGALAWLLRHYYPQDIHALHDGEWLDRFFTTSVQRSARGMTGLDFYDPIAPGMQIAERLRVPLPSVRGPSSHSLGDLLRNGDFSRFSTGKQPFDSSNAASDGWELIAGSGHSIRLARRAFTSSDPGPEDREGHYLHVEVPRRKSGEAFFLQRVPGITRLAGSFVSLRFWARSPDAATISTYFFQQTGDPTVPCQGTIANDFELTTDWHLYTYTTTLPPLTSKRLGAGNHTEVVFRIPLDGNPSCFDLAMVELCPGTLSREHRAA